ncbi:hypothetical protein [Paenibacillus sp. 598K]|uniref:hypothetical protein n=1 Tax=Paenibacillus sp. 598K TaxID=1117987 RepID=UPI000FFF06AD|nr:hypothetical protein [Paenibacillus sp. 598K]
MTMIRRLWWKPLLLIVVIVGSTHGLYYLLTKQALERSLRHELGAVAGQIEIAIEQSRLGAEKYQEQIGRQLRSVSIAAQYALDADIEKVRNEQLIELSERLGVLHITLLKRTEDDIVLYRSSDSRQLGLKTSSWKPWYEAFNQLFDKRQVTIDWGQSLDNFWTGPFEVASSDTSKVRKWGYYYDGSTNYIIDPYVSYDMQREYEELTGADRLIEQTLLKNPTLLEIGAVNPSTYPRGEQLTETELGEELRHITQMPVFYGSNAYVARDELRHIDEAYRTNTPVTIRTTIAGRPVMKQYVPVSIDRVASILDAEGQPLDRYVLTIVSDYRQVQDALTRQWLMLAGIAAVLILCAAVVASRLRRPVESRPTEDEVGSSRLAAIRSLAEQGKLDELCAYVDRMTEEDRQARLRQSE